MYKKQLELHKSSILQTAGISLAMIVVMLVMFTIISIIMNDPEFLKECFLMLPFLVIVLSTMIITFLGIMVSTVQVKNGVSMSMTRTEMTNIATFLVFVMQAVNLLICVVCSYISNMVGVFTGIETRSIFSLMPFYFWIIIFCVPIAVGIFASGIILLFGKKGGILLYAIFMASCILPSFFNGESTEDESGDVSFDSLNNIDISFILITLAILVIMYFLGRKMIKHFNM